MVINSASADVNGFGTPQLYVSPSNIISVAEDATNVQVVFNIAQETTANGLIDYATPVFPVIPGLSFSANYANRTVTMSGTASNTQSLTGHNIQITDSSLNVLSFSFSMEILDISATTTQDPCSYCVDAEPVYTAGTIQNSYLLNRVKTGWYLRKSATEYEFLGEGLDAEMYNICLCLAGEYTIVPSIRAYAPVGNTCPDSIQLVLEIVGNEHTFNITEYKPFGSFDVPASCCFENYTEMVVYPYAFGANYQAPHNTCGPAVSDATSQVQLIYTLKDENGTTVASRTYYSFSASTQNSQGVGKQLTLTAEQTIDVADFDFNYTFSIVGKYTLTIQIKNCCGTYEVLNQVINVCGQALITNPDCNKILIQNRSTDNLTYTVRQLGDSDFVPMVPPVSAVLPGWESVTLEFTNDNVYEITIVPDSLSDATGVYRVLLDCNIKKCNETTMLDFLCGECDECADDKDLQVINKRVKFKVLQDAIYSIWAKWRNFQNNVSIPNEQGIYSDAQVLPDALTIKSYIAQISKLCNICNSEENQCNVTYSNLNSDCGCNE